MLNLMILMRERNKISERFNTCNNQNLNTCLQETVYYSRSSAWYTRRCGFESPNIDRYLMFFIYYFTSLHLLCRYVNNSSHNILEGYTHHQRKKSVLKVERNKSVQKVDKKKSVLKVEILSHGHGIIIIACLVD